MEECCLYILKLLDSGLKLQNPMLEASRQSSNSNLIIIALSNLLLAVNPRSGKLLDFWKNNMYRKLYFLFLFQENPIICWMWLNLWSIPGDFPPMASMLSKLFTGLENLRLWPSLHFWPLLGLMKTLLIPLSKVKWNNFGH